MWQNISVWLFDRILPALGGATILIPVLGAVLPNKAVYALGKGAGRIVTIFFRQRVGKAYEPVEKYFQGTLDSFIRGLHDGLDTDDEQA